MFSFVKFKALRSIKINNGPLLFSLPPNHVLSSLVQHLHTFFLLYFSPIHFFFVDLVALCGTRRMAVVLVVSTVLIAILCSLLKSPAYL